MTERCRILTGDCRNVLAVLEPESVQCCVTSPPYWGLRDYGTAQWEGGEEGCDHLMPNASYRQDGGRVNVNGFNGSSRSNLAEKSFKEACGKCGARRIDSQLGLESTIEEYLANMVAVFREVWRVLKPDGTLWVNMGDRYCSTAPGTMGDIMGNLNLGEACAKARQRFRPETPKGLKPKDLCMIPARLAMALQADGWYLRSEIVWHKPNPMPESVTDRPTKSHEMIYLLAKQERYFYDAEAIREKNGSETDIEEYQRIKRLGTWPSMGITGYSHGAKSDFAPFLTHPMGRNKRSVWTIATQPYSEAHFATFPEEIPKLCILAGSKLGDTILDPFGGSGTTAKVALELGRKVILIELNPVYIELSRKRTFVTSGFL